MLKGSLNIVSGIIFQGWDPATGWPTRPTLESMGLGAAADELEKRGKLGA